jgi:SRSO17 transposase
VIMVNCTILFSSGVWDAAPLETELLTQADRLVGGSDAVLVIDDTAVPKKGQHSVGVAPQYASALGKTANCQTLVSLTLARGEVPVMVALRLFLPENWTSDRRRLERAGFPVEYRTARTKPEIALAEIDRVIAAGVRFGCVLADAGFRMSAPFRQGLTNATGSIQNDQLPATQSLWGRFIAKMYRRRSSSEG